MSTSIYQNNQPTPNKNHIKLPKNKQNHTHQTFPLLILSNSMVNNTTSVVLSGTWPFGIPGLPEVKKVSRPQDVNSISVLKIRIWPRFRMDVIEILIKPQTVCSAPTWTNMTALVYSHICLKAFYKFAWNSARDGTVLLNDRLRASLHYLNSLGPQIQVETYVFNQINSLT